MFSFPFLWFLIIYLERSHSTSNIDIHRILSYTLILPLKTVFIFNPPIFIWYSWWQYYPLTSITKPIKIILALIKACDYRPFNLQYLGFFYEIHVNVLFILSVFLVFILILELTDWGVKWKLYVNILKSSYKWMTFRVFLTDFSKSIYSHYQFVINVFLLWIFTFHNI